MTAFIFFIGAFESTSSTISLCLYELARNLELQKKVQVEVDEITTKYPTTNYEALMELKFLDCCIYETLRKYPPAPFLMRECEMDYEVEETSQIIRKGTLLIIPAFGIHRDPEIFAQPLEFRPERFENSSTGDGESEGLFYFPFGDGPRICIGKRMGLLTVRLGLFLMLQKFNFEFPDEKIPEIFFSPKQFVLTIRDDILLKISKR